MKELSEIQKKLSVPKSRQGGQGNYKYRSVDDIMEAAKKLLPEDCIILTYDDLVEVGGAVFMKSTAAFMKGDQSISSFGYAKIPAKLAAMSDPQITGSCSSYARKAALCGLLMIDDNKDPDSLTKTETGLSLPATDEQREELILLSNEVETKNPANAEYIRNQVAKDDLSFEKAKSMIERLKNG